MGAPPDVGEFGRSSIEIVGASYVKAAPLVPMAVLTTAVTGRRVPVPGEMLHVIDVIDTHCEARQAVVPIETVDERSYEPKLLPITVSVVPAVTAALLRSRVPTPGVSTVTVWVEPVPVSVGGVATVPMAL
jgi:hypothetical protein